MVIEYLYDPEIVREVLSEYPSLRQNLKDPYREGQGALSFPGLRKTRREIYRILSNPHYQHLCELLTSLDYCIANGWQQPALLQTRGQKEFESAVAELLVAKAFIGNGFSVRNPKREYRSKRVPDMLAHVGELSISVEVYCPLDWGGMDRFFEDLRLGLLHLDIPLDFNFEFTMKVMDQFDSEGRPLWFNPWQFSEATENPKERWARIKPFWAEVQRGLTESERQAFIARVPDESLNTISEIRLDQIRNSLDCMPNRFGSIIPPTLTGYAPEAMFDHLIAKRVLKKIRKGQAQSLPGEHLRALIVDVSRLDDAHQFQHPWYLKRFAQTVVKHIDPEKVDIDLVAFCLPASSE